MRSDTIRKLEEADYFLDQMKINRDRYFPFIYNLSAFLSAARSVTLFMQKEYTKIPNFSKWYNLKREEMKQDEDFNFFNEMRVTTVHHKSVIPDQTLESVQPEIIYVSEGLLIQPIDEDGNVLTEEKINSKKDKKLRTSEKDRTFNILWTFKERPQKTVLELCQEHITKLDELVSECEERFK